jgi:hypothetical protein
MWFALKIILYLLAAGGILAWCAYSLRKSRDLLGKYLRSLPAEEVQELADRADNSYEQLASGFWWTASEDAESLQRGRSCSVSVPQYFLFRTLSSCSISAERLSDSEPAPST